MPMDGNDGVEHIMRTSPMGKNKAVEKFSKDFSTASNYLLIGIPASNVLLPVYKTFAGKCF